MAYGPLLKVVRSKIFGYHTPNYTDGITHGSTSWARSKHTRVGSNDHQEDLSALRNQGRPRTIDSLEEAYVGGAIKGPVPAGSVVLLDDMPPSKLMSPGVSNRGFL